MPTPMRHARLFRNGPNQAVRIPRELELSTNELVICRDEERLILVPVDSSPSLAEVLASLAPLDVDIPEIQDPPAQPEDLL